MIEKELLEEMFDRIRAGTIWNIDGEMLWGYFFADKDPKKLKPLSEELSKRGYRIVDIYPTDDKSTYFLHVEKVEKHSVESLHKRNLDFNELADQFKVDSYDGMDVGPVERKE